MLNRYHGNKFTHPLCSDTCVLFALGLSQVAMKDQLEEQVRKDMGIVQACAWGRIGDHPDTQLRNGISIFQAARLFNFCFVKQHQLTGTEINLLQESFPFVTEEIICNLVSSSTS